MAGMRPSVLYEKIASAYCQRTGGSRLPILPDCNRQIVSCSPLEGDCRPRADELCKPDPRGSGFLCADVSPDLRRRSDLRRRGFFCAVADCGLARAPKPFTLCGFKQTREERPWPGPLPPSSRSASASRSTATCRPSSDPRRIRVGPEWGASPPSCSARRRGRLSAMELSLPDMPVGVGGRRARAAAHPGEPRGHGRRRKLGADQRLARSPPAASAIAGAASARRQRAEARSKP